MLCLSGFELYSPWVPPIIICSLLSLVQVNSPLSKVTSFKYSVDAIVMPIYRSKQRSKLVKQFSINITFIRMSALKKIVNDTFSSNSTQLTYQKGWRLYWQNWMHAQSNILIHKTCELGANNIRCVILPPKSKQTKKDSWVTLSYTEPGQSTPMFLLPFSLLKEILSFPRHIMEILNISCTD